jgi:spore germination protein KA
MEHKMTKKQKINLNRSIQEPPTSPVLMGPREGFIEDSEINFLLIKKRLKTKYLKKIELEIGKISKTKVVVTYLGNIARENIVKEIIKKLKTIKIDAIIDSYYLVEFLEKRPNSIFKQVGNTEKPDVTVAKMLEGRVAIIVDGSPIVLTLPFILIEDLQSPEDYYQKSFRVSIIRWIRFLGALIAMLLPGIYVATMLYHYEIVPLNLLVTLANSSANLPVNPVVEMLFIIILFEILYEANMRMPRYMGMALSIVGALILGDTAVRAGLVSPPAVMIVALSSITIYTIPNQAGQLSVLRFLFTLVGAIFTLYGVAIVFALLTIYLSSLNSYGSHYLSPIIPFIKEDQKDAITKKSLLSLKNRPKSIKNKNSVRLREPKGRGPL